MAQSQALGGCLQTTVSESIRARVLGLISSRDHLQKQSHFVLVSDPILFISTDIAMGFGLVCGIMRLFMAILYFTELIFCVKQLPT